MLTPIIDEVGESLRIMSSMHNNIQRRTASSSTQIDSVQAESIMVDGAALSPQLNMAVDSWLAKRMPLMESKAVLRLYRWAPAGISIGRNQRWERALNHSALQQGELAVRRITGGRAIYHDTDELTYSLVMKLPARIGQRAAQVLQGHPNGDSVESVAVQKRIATLIVQSLLEFLRNCGIDAEAERRVGYVPAHRPDRQSPHCFVSTARHEITSCGTKIVASAQRIHGGRFFQHGSIKFAGPVSHPALFERPDKDKNPRAPGNNCYEGKCYTVAGDGVHSECEMRAPEEASPSNLRRAFEATFSEDRVSIKSPPALTPLQMGEVLKELADIDSIVGVTGTIARSSASSRILHKQTPHKQHRDSPHTESITESISEKGAPLPEQRPGKAVAGMHDSRLRGVVSEEEAARM